MQMKPAEHTPDPYRIFFPLGVFFGLIGVAIWPVYALGWIETVQSAWHIDIQLQGFLFAFVLGFLLTALPRFSLTWHATMKELVFFSLVFFIGNMATVLNYREIGRIGFAINMIALLVFALRRFSKRKSTVPNEFVFVGVGILLGLTAAIIRWVGTFYMLDGNLELMARRLIPEGMIFLLVIGIGSKLAPMFWGFVSGPPVSPLEITNQKLSKVVFWYLFLALLIAASFPIEYYSSEKLAMWIRAVVSSILFFGVMKIHRTPKNKGVLVQVLRFSAWAIALAPWGSVFHSQYRVENLHVMFVAGFGVMILSIATRVILSHGNHPMHLEKTSTSLLIGSIFLGMAMIFRSISSLFAEHYFQLLGAAGFLWMSGLLIWGIVFSARAIRKARAV